MKRSVKFLETVFILSAVLMTAPCFGSTDADPVAEAEPLTVEAAEADISQTAPDSLQDNLVLTKHTAVINGEELAYTAETGTMLLTTGGETCEIFYTAYTLDDVEDPSDRPITFAFNGGPGCCSMYLHIGCLGPRRLELSEDGYPVSLPTQVVDNENSLLDITDLVFIDSVGTGYSRPAGDSTIDAFSGYDKDNRTFGDFIRQYVSRNNRWESEKYLAGESYGTVRAVGVCKYLADSYSMYLNGLMLISSVNDFISLYSAGENELPYVTFLPTFAADAWYHGKVGKEYRKMELEEFLDEVRTFVEREYAPALFMGDQLSEEEMSALAKKMAAYTGLSAKYLAERNLRISLSEFSSELLRDQKLVIGRFDGRVTGPVTSGYLDNGTNDPSDSMPEVAFGSAANAYIGGELAFRTDREYVPMNAEVMNGWSFAGEDGIGYQNQENIINECMSKNSFLKVWVLCGYYDAATPFYGAEWVYRHLFLNDELKDNLTFTYYPSGHMVYIDQYCLDLFRNDAENWYGK